MTSMCAFCVGVMTLYIHLCPTVVAVQMTLGTISTQIPVANNSAYNEKGSATWAAMLVNPTLADAALVDNSRIESADAPAIDSLWRLSAADPVNFVSKPGFSLKKGPLFTHNWTNRLLVWPDRKFAFCYVEKDACTQFNKVFNHANKRKGTWFVSTVDKFPDIDPAKITRQNGWRMGIFARDPAERLLSAWSSKCIEWEDQGKDCIVGGRKEPDDQRAFENMVLNKLPEYAKASRAKDGFNAHYDPQAIFCGARGLAEYDFVGRLSSNYSDVSEQVHQMFRDVAQVPSDSSFFEYLRAAFPPSHPAGHTSTKDTQKKRFLSTPAVSDMIKQVYKADYEKFGFAPGLSTHGYQG
mmetsp:Transcript_22964/g.48822  ORF Transcript_22964/g.48822 Transcript_22964/m.48822 type:complete len:353 (-) Transcript_22964:79-1137(-)